MEGISGDVPVDIENPCVITLETSIRKKLDSLSPLSPSRCIYRVPKLLRSINEKAYTPQVVSIGPLHHGMEALKAMEEHKKRYLQDFLGRSEVSLKEYIKKIRGHEARLRSCYEETINFSSDEFVEMILVDAAFIFELFLKYKIPELQDENDPIFRGPTGFSYLRSDIYLLENQLPLFILEDLFYPDKITLPSNETCEKPPSIRTLTLNVFKQLMYSLGVEEENVKLDMLSSNIHHFVDLIRMVCRPMKSLTQVTDMEVNTPNMTELHRAGVKFKVGSSKDPFSMRFDNGILEIPKLQISDDTECLFRNLIAFEQCHPVGQYYVISDYMFMMGYLVKSPNDVDLLVEYEIVDNLIGDNSEVSAMINRIGIGIYVQNNFRYSSLCNDLNKYCNSRCHKWKANLRQNYFNTPWATISVIAAVVLLILTVLQTVFTIYSPT